MTRKCIKCGKTKDISEFYFRNDSKNYHSRCKKCMREYDSRGENQILQKEYRMIRNPKIYDATKYTVENGGTSFGGYKYVILNSKRVTGSKIQKFSNKDYIETESEKAFNFLLDNLPTDVFQALKAKIIDYDDRLKNFMAKYDKITLKKENN